MTVGEWTLHEEGDTRMEVTSDRSRSGQQSLVIENGPNGSTTALAWYNRSESDAPRFGRVKSDVYLRGDPNNSSRKGRNAAMVFRVDPSNPTGASVWVELRKELKLVERTDTASNPTVLDQEPADFPSDQWITIDWKVWETSNGNVAARVLVDGSQIGVDLVGDPTVTSGGAIGVGTSTGGLRANFFDNTAVYYE